MRRSIYKTFITLAITLFSTLAFAGQVKVFYNISTAGGRSPKIADVKVYFNDLSLPSEKVLSVSLHLGQGMGEDIWNKISDYKASYDEVTNSWVVELNKLIQYEPSSPDPRFDKIQFTWQIVYYKDGGEHTFHSNGTQTPSGYYEAKVMEDGRSNTHGFVEAEVVTVDKW